MGQRGGQDDPKIQKQRRSNKKESGVPQHPPILKERVAKMGPSWFPQSSPNHLNIHIKIGQKMMHLGIDCWEDFDGFGMKIEASWHPNQLHIDIICENVSFQ